MTSRTYISINHANLTLLLSRTIQIDIEMKLMDIKKNRQNSTREILNQNLQCRWFFIKKSSKRCVSRASSTKIYHCLAKPYKSTIYYIGVQNQALSVCVTETQIQLKWLGFFLYFILQQLRTATSNDALFQQCQFGWVHDLKLKQANHKIFVCCNI